MSRGQERPPSLRQLARFATAMERHPYRFAKRLWRNPHFYTLIKEWANKEDFYDCVQFIRNHGFHEMFPKGLRGQPYTCFHLNGYKYWSMGAPLDKTILINRAVSQYRTDFCSIASDYDDMFADESYLRETGDAMGLIGEVKDKRILDIGAGTGAFLDMRGDEVSPQNYVAIDPSEAMVHIFSQKHRPFIDSMTKSKFEDFYAGSFDLIISTFGSPSYIEPSFITRIPQMLKKGGRYFLMFYQTNYQPVSCRGDHKSNHFRKNKFIASLGTAQLRFTETSFSDFSIIENGTP
jgi:hypothetical protein